MPEHQQHPRTAPFPRAHHLGSIPAVKWERNQKGRDLPVTLVNSAFLIFRMTFYLHIKWGGEGQWAYNIRWNLNELPSLLGHFSCEAGWIFMVFVSVYMSIPWRVIATEMHALYSTVIFHYILTENKHNQMYATSYVSTNRSYTHNPLFLLVFSSTVCSISACYRISHF